MSQLVDLSKLPAPDVLEEIDFETLLAERKAKFISLYPEDEQAYWTARLAMEAEPIVKLLEENCYLQMLERQRINNAAKATMLAYATGTDLDVLAANFNVSRLVIQEADNTVNPPVEEIKESDDDLRLRVQLAFEGLSVAGPRSAYLYHALSAHAEVGDVSVVSPQPAQVVVTVLSRIGKGVPSAAVLKAVNDKLNDESVRPIADRVTVQAVTIRDYQIRAKLYMLKGPEYEPIKQQAQKRLIAYTEERRRLGRDITLSGIYAALHIEGVQRVELLEPTQNIILNNNQAGYCTNMNIEVAVSDDY